MQFENTIIHSAIGGYFELELAQGTGEYHRNVLRYQSARAAFLALLRAGRPATIWMPWYVCDSMMEPPVMAGIPVRRYGLDAELQIVDAQPGVNDWLLYVNYFGVCRRGVMETLRRFDSERIIIDNSQAFFNPAEDCLATIYSPRKFFGVPDGGYLATKLDMREPEEIDQGSIGRCTHLLRRLGDEPEKGYADFVAADSSLSGQEPKRMSRLTQTLLSHIPYGAIGAKRKENFALLHERLAASNGFPLDPREDEVSLCYPYLPRCGCDPEALRAKRIYVPRYWPKIAVSNVVPEFEVTLAQNTLFLPCDQRMTEKLMERMLQVLAGECSFDEVSAA
ncbi:hypothetical protein [Pseudothauera rhizosphaerae]|uniref:dTDP-4-amino-4,6-dideoxygalactose transaminase n=1 Tax=Pseudothauera rhizosphaerae TaxID=2565932 RepID=A0A4S4AVT8_9RHOO|nr:hypothetical protein [Pseudothauera rhizosphaerae]THF64144.1 hypothetical protein E6O51_02125 [Pseudothauera rhizosphaerae]